MKLDPSLEPANLSLDITPLIDIVFLLVLFFAVTTSFISPEDLEALKQQVQILLSDNTGLSSEIEQQRDTIDQTRSELVKTAARLETEQTKNRAAELRMQRLDQTLDVLRKEQTQLQTRLGATGEIQTRLQQQLDTANSAQTQLQEQLADARDQDALLRDELATSRAAASKLQQELDTRMGLQAQLRAFRQLETKLREQVARLSSENSALATETAGLRENLAKTNSENARYKRFYDANQERIERARQTEQAFTSSFNAMDLNSVLNIERKQNQLAIQLSNQILFDSGSADLKAGGLDVLRRVGTVLKDKLGELTLQVGGHTDNVPISGGGLYPNNWALSAARAVNVVDFLEQDVGIDPDLMSGVGYGEYRPIAPNDTPQNRALNRRIELVLLPQQALSDE